MSATRCPGGKCPKKSSCARYEEFSPTKLGWTMWFVAPPNHTKNEETGAWDCDVFKDKEDK